MTGHVMIPLRPIRAAVRQAAACLPHPAQCGAMCRPGCGLLVGAAIALCSALAGAQQRDAPVGAPAVAAGTATAAASGERRSRFFAPEDGQFDLS